MQLIIALVCIYALFKLQAIIYKLSWKKGFSAGISIESLTCREGDNNSLTETVTNNKLLPLPMVNVKFTTPRSFVFDNEDNSSVTDYYYRNDVFSLLNRQKIKRTLNFRCTRRGCYSINDITIITSDLLMRHSMHRLKFRYILIRKPKAIRLRIKCSKASATFSKTMFFLPRLLRSFGIR